MFSMLVGPWEWKETQVQTGENKEQQKNPKFRWWHRMEQFPDSAHVPVVDLPFYGFN
jgi:hypothetical protein